MPSQPALSDPALSVLALSDPGLAEPVMSDAVRPAPVQLAAPRSAACRYAAQCAFRQPVCTERVPPLALIEPGHQVRCWFPVGHEPLDRAAAPDPAAIGVTTPRKGA